MAVYYARSVKFGKASLTYVVGDPNLVSVTSIRTGTVLDRAPMPISVGKTGLVDISEIRKHYLASITTLVGVTVLTLWQRTGRVMGENVSAVVPSIVVARAVLDPTSTNVVSNGAFGWSETRHVGNDVAGVLTTGIRWANFFTGEGISNTLVYKVSPSIVRTFISTDAINIYNFEGATLHLVDPENVQTILANLQTSVEWRTMRPEERSLILWAASSAAISWESFWVISDPALIAVAENPAVPIYIRFFSGMGLTGVRDSGALNTMHYAMSRENVIDIYAFGNIAGMRQMEGNELLGLTSSGILVPLRWLSQNDKPATWDEEDDDVHAFARQADGTLVPMKAQVTQVGTFHPQNDKSSTWRN